MDEKEKTMYYQKLLDHSYAMERAHGESPPGKRKFWLCIDDKKGRENERKKLHRVQIFVHGWNRV